jgi:hypothetical protein
MRQNRCTAMSERNATGRISCLEKFPLAGARSVALTLLRESVEVVSGVGTAGLVAAGIALRRTVSRLAQPQSSTTTGQCRGNVAHGP